MAAVQAGVVSRSQLLDLGVSARQVDRLASERWQRLHPGVFFTGPGPVPDMALVWAVILRAGEGAVAGPRTSLGLYSVRTELPRPLDVCVPSERKILVAGIHVTRRSHLDRIRHPVLLPARLRLEEAVLDDVALHPIPQRPSIWCCG